MKTVHVAAGIVQHGGDVLAVQRGYGDMAGLWEFPGGKLEPGETAEEACARELNEELDIAVTNLRDFYTVEYDYSEFHLSMKCFFCELEQDASEPADTEEGHKQAGTENEAGVAADGGGQNQAEDEGEIRTDALSDDAGNAQATSAPQATGTADDKAAATADDEAATAAEPAAAPEPPTTAKPPHVARKDHQLDVRWVPRRSLATLSWMPADQEVVRVLTEADSAAADEQLVKARADNRRSMQGNKRANTKPEMIVRQKLREASLPGYRLQWKKAPGTPDIAYPGRKVAIFVNGCFWHRCPHCHPKVPKRNTEFWEAKFKRNVERDAEVQRELEELGWTVIVIWECQLKKPAGVDATMAPVIEQVRAAKRER